MNSLCSFDDFKQHIKNNLLDIVYKKYSNSNITNDKYGFIYNHINYDLEYLLNNFEYVTENYFYTFDNMIYLSVNVNDIFENLNYCKIAFENFVIIKENLENYFPIINLNNILNLFDYPLEIKEAFTNSIHDILKYDKSKLNVYNDMIFMNYNDILKYCINTNEIKNQLNNLLKNI